MRASCRLVCLGIIAFAAQYAPSEAAQALLPTPYPGAAPGTAPLDPGTPRAGGGQEIMKDPYPQATGPTSQGNPPTMRSRRGQRLVPSIDERKYRVDRPAR